MDYGVSDIVAKAKARCFASKNVVSIIRKSIAAYESELSVANAKGEFFEKTAVITAHTETHEEVLHTARVSMITLELIEVYKDPSITDAVKPLKYQAVIDKMATLEVTPEEILTPLWEAVQEIFNC